jgi:threonine/homoserine/homoserine lactone efflux protein
VAKSFNRLWHEIVDIKTAVTGLPKTLGNATRTAKEIDTGKWYAIWFASTQILIYGSFAWGAGSIQQWLCRNPAAQVAIGRGMGLLLMLAALWTGWHGIRLGY